MTAMTVLVALTAAFSVLFLALDARDRGFRDGLWRDRARARRNLAYAIANVITMIVLASATRAVKPFVPVFVSWDHAPGGVGGALEIAVCILVAEWVNWVAHWAKHRVPFLWRFHLQHHVETNYNTQLTIHTHGLEVVFTGVVMSSLLVALGFSQVAVDVFTLSYFVANLYKHCSAKLSLGPLDWILVSPAYHRVHHGKHEEGNYGSVLTFWDVIFRTAKWVPRERAFSLELGTRGGEPFGFVAEMLAFLRRG
jgi:sterol desaturase/sphingolipid hydroxylase (fatty acid hydroxylase superfamily)